MTTTVYEVHVSNKTAFSSRFDTLDHVRGFVRTQVPDGAIVEVIEIQTQRRLMHPEEYRSEAES